MVTVDKNKIINPESKKCKLLQCPNERNNIHVASEKIITKDFKSKKHSKKKKKQKKARKDECSIEIISVSKHENIADSIDDSDSSDTKKSFSQEDSSTEENYPLRDFWKKRVTSKKITSFERKIWVEDDEEEFDDLSSDVES